MSTEEKEYVYDDGSSDSSPEEVTFQIEHTKALHTMKTAADQIKFHKEHVRKKRREFHERNSIQKKEKRKKLAGKKLPDDILEKISNLPSKQQVLSKRQPKKRVFVEEKDNVEKQNPKATDSFVNIHGPTVFQVKVLSKELKKPNAVSDTASTFRQKALYGKKNCRETTQECLFKIEKQKYSANVLRPWKNY